MAWFFTDENINSNFYSISGENAKHISKSLRMSKGEEITLITPNKMQYDCQITEITSEFVNVEIVSKKICENEPDVFVTLYQALPKSDKMDFIIQKCVELGISKIVPVISARCISRPDEKSMKKKIERWQKISLQAAMQSRRGIIPKIENCMTFSKAIEKSKDDDKSIIFYELGGEKIKDILSEKPKTISMFIGSEGGFEKNEVEMFLQNTGRAATLGKRILRAETAPIAALSVIMYQTENFDTPNTIEYKLNIDD